MSEAVQKSPSPEGSVSKVVVASLVGNTMEWYDFSIFSASSALVFSKIFFSNADPAQALLYSLLTYGVGFVARPLGGVLFGHFGDRFGRKPILLVTFLLMGGSTLLMGVLPTFQTAGFAAPALLVLLRIIQGLALGGEYGGAALMVSEAVPQKRRGFLTSTSFIGLGLGSALGATVFGIFATLPPATFLAWGWRIPFLLSGILIILGLWLRIKVNETPEFRQMKARQRVVKVPLLRVLRQDLKHVALVCLARSGETMQYNVTAVFGLGFATRYHGAHPSVYLSAISISSLLTILVMPTAGALSDRIGRRPVGIVAGLTAVVFGALLLPLIGSGNNYGLMLGVIAMLGISAGIGNSLPNAYFPELFDVEIRYTAISLGYQTGTILGGLTPAICTLLFIHYGIAAIYGYVILAGIMILGSFLLLPETLHQTAKSRIGVGTLRTKEGD
jgi:MHS family shikimate/dehydroshikimate transporter-like MFS transporter